MIGCFKICIRHYIFKKPLRTVEKKNEKVGYISGKVGYISGADLFVKNNSFARFDENYFMYYEETEMQNRFHRGGFESWCINTPKIKHLVGQSVKNDKSYSLRRFIGQLESRYLYIRKVFGLFDRYIIYLILNRIYMYKK